MGVGIGSGICDVVGGATESSAPSNVVRITAGLAMQSCLAENCISLPYVGVRLQPDLR
jgi:hypothetical protein